MADQALPASESVPATATGNYTEPGTVNAPGFRFQPSDEELINYYLKRKVQGNPMVSGTIAEVDVYEHEPSDLAELSRLKTKDQQWFFFCTLEKKYGGSSTRIKRGTKIGHWKQTGEDREILREDHQLIGKVKSLVFQRGPGRKAQRTNWMIHEYHLVENKVEINSYVLCRVFRKQDAGRSGYICAPFSEQDWDDDDDNGGKSPVLSFVHANRIKQKIQQENPLQSKDLIDLNELFRMFDVDEDPKTVDQDDNNNEPLTRERLPLCVLNKEAPVPLIQYKRKRQIDSLGSYNNSNQTTQDHCSFPEKIGDITSSVAAMMEENEPEPVATMVPTSSSTELINDLQNEKQQMAVEKEAHKLDMMKAEMMISFLQEKINALREENEELKKINSNKGQRS